MISRRTFLKNSGLGLGLCWSLPTLGSAPSPSPLYQRFLNPTAEAKPFVRWWWNGNCVTADEIRRELNVLHQAGIGGVEINPVAMPEYILTPEVGKPLEWMSDEYRAMLQVAVTEAQKLGMHTDLIVGTGWPFGGKFIAPSETLQGIKTELKTLQITDNIEGKIPFENTAQKRLFQLKLIPQGISDMGQIIDLPVAADGTYQLTNLRGTYDLLLLTWENQFRTVLHGSPGGDGPVLDHFNQQAVEKYLNRMSDALKLTFGSDLGRYFRAFFCDSIELSGANWTGDFSDEFSRRRGYAVEPYLALVLNEKMLLKEPLKTEIEKVRFDYTQTMSELFMERFVLTFHRWCQKMGVRSRYQAYGHPWLYNPMIDGFGVPDIPEGDQWLFSNAWQPYCDIDQIRYAIWNKYASSAGNLNTRRIVSAEAMTNTAGVFRDSLAYIKQATDLNFITGINHLILHGYNYSPPQAGFPGWVRYGTYFNEQNPWWQYMPRYTQYTARISQLMQDTQAVSQVAILGPTSDLWAKFGAERNAFNNEVWYLHCLWQALNINGVHTDYVSEKIVQEAHFQAGRLAFGAMKYELLIIADVKSLSLDTVKGLDEYVQQGGKIVFVNTLPVAVAGRQYEQYSATLKTQVARFLEKHPSQVWLVKAPEQKDFGMLTNWAEALLSQANTKPALQFSNPDSRLYFIHRKAANFHFFLLCNLDPKRTIRTHVRFQSPHTHASVWNPETGERSQISLINNTFDLHLTALQSLIVVFETQKQVLKPHPSASVFVAKQTLTIPWQVETQNPLGEKCQLTLTQLADFRAIEASKTLSGELWYRSTFEVKNKKQFSYIHLGQVHETAEVWLNDHPLGICWYGQPLFHLQEKLQNGPNTLTIKVSTTLYNFVAARQEHPATQFWQGKTRLKDPIPTGLLGPVQLG